MGLRLALRDRLRRPAVRARDGPLTRRTATRTAGGLAHVHPDSGWLLALAYAGFFLNLFNLIPLSPLDGGRITQVISPRLWLLGMPVLGAVFLWRPSPLLLLIGVLAGLQLWQDRQRRRDPAAQPYRAGITLETRLTYGFFYVVLLAFLAVMCHDLHTLLQRRVGT